MSKSTRKFSNLVLDRGALARLSVPFVLMIVLSVAIVGVIRWKVVHALEHTELSGVENLPAMNTLLELQRTITSIGIVGVTILGLVCMGLWIFYSHRIFGPVIPMRRHIEKLGAGDFSSRIQLRGTDEFKALAEDLNHLAEVLGGTRPKV